MPSAVSGFVVKSYVGIGQLSGNFNYTFIGEGTFAAHNTKRATHTTTMEAFDLTVQREMNERVSQKVRLLVHLAT